VPILLNNQSASANNPNKPTENQAYKKKNLYSKLNNNSSDQQQQQGFTSSPSSNSNIETANTSSQQASSETAAKQPKEEPMDTSSLKEPPTPTSASSAAAAATAPTPATAIDVDKWFDDIQQNQSTSLIGKNLKSYAQIFKLVALKIATGFSSTLSSNTQKSFVSPTKTTKTSAQPKTQFAATLIPTMSSINLDKSLFEELKPSKLATQMPVIAPLSGPSPAPAPGPAAASSSNSLLSNLLTQRTNMSEVVILDPINSQTSSPHTSMMPQQQAQILTNYNQYGGGSMSGHGAAGGGGGSGGLGDLHEGAFNMNRSQG
jgi:hypothetical protein